MSSRSLSRTSAFLIFIAVLAGFTLAGAIDDNAAGPAWGAGPYPSSETSPSKNLPGRDGVLDPATDIAVEILAPRVVTRGSSFNATIVIANWGTSTAKWVSCGVATPRADAVSNSRLTVAARTTFDPVEGNESKVFVIALLRPRETRSVMLYGTAVTGTSTEDFDISVFCVPSHVDANQSNNAALRTVTLWVARE